MLFVLLSVALAGAPIAKTSVRVGELTVSGLSDLANHTHGGPAASLNSARFKLANVGPSVSLVVSQVEYLRGHSCSDLPTKVAATLQPTSVFFDHKVLESTAVTVTSGEHEITVLFKPVEAYYTYCDVFAFRVTFRAGEESFTVVSDVSVMREEPYEPL